MKTQHRLLGLMTAAALLLLATPALAGGFQLSGTVVGDNGSELTPLANVRINITPLGPVKGKKTAPVDDLVGVATTTPLGKFKIAVLSSPSEQSEHALLKKWRYHIKIVADGHYIFDQEITVGGKAEVLDFVVKSRDYHVDDDTQYTGGGNEGTLGNSGKVVRGT